MTTIHELSTALTEGMVQTMSGLAFNKFGGKFVKFLRQDMRHHDFQFRVGFNMDTNKWVPENTCQYGIFFTTVESSHYWSAVEYTDHALVADVIIPDEACVAIFQNKIKSSMIILSNIRPIADMPEWKSADEKTWVGYVAQNCLNLKYMPTDHFPMDTLRKFLSRTAPNYQYWSTFLKYVSRLNDQFQIIGCMMYECHIDNNRRDDISMLMLRYMDAGEQERKIMRQQYTGEKKEEDLKKE